MAVIITGRQKDHWKDCNEMRIGMGRGVIKNEDRILECC